MINSVSNQITGNGTMQIGGRMRGKILAVKVTADSNVTNNFDVTLTGNTTGIPILLDASVANNATTWFHPRSLVAKESDGSAATDAFVQIPVLNEPIQCVTANAGTTGTITVTVIYDAER